MLTEKKMYKLAPSIEAINKAKAFSEEVVDTLVYKNTERNIYKIKQDHFIGKLAEEAVYILYHSLGYDISKPDYSVYSSTDKSFSSDLQLNGKPLAVKAQTASMAKITGLSWTFQVDPKRFDPIVHQPEALVVCVLVDDSDDKMTCYVFPIKEIQDLVFKQPMFRKYIGKKLVVYAEDNFRNEYN